MKTALIIHGTLGNPTINWFPWLKKELEAIGYQVFSPQFPTPEGQTIDNWLQVMDQNIAQYSKETILIGHSSACLAICAKLQKLESPIKAAFLAAPFYGDIGLSDYDQYNHAFNVYTYDWNKVKQGAEKICVYRSHTDPYVPDENGAQLAVLLSIQETIIENGGHLTEKAGFTTFPQLLEDIKKLT